MRRSLPWIGKDDRGVRVRIMQLLSSSRMRRRTDAAWRRRLAEWRRRLRLRGECSGVALLSRRPLAR